MNECVAKPCFGMGFTNDKGKFSPLENFDQVLHSQHVHGFVIKICGRKQHFGAHLANKEDWEKSPTVKI